MEKITRPVSKYAAKRKAKLAALLEESVDAAPSASMLVRVPEKREKKIRISVKDMVREQLYGREGGAAYHAGNPFALAFNEALNK